MKNDDKKQRSLYQKWKKKKKKSLKYFSFILTMKIKVEIACHKVNIFITRNDTFHFFFFSLVLSAITNRWKGWLHPLFIYNNQNSVCERRHHQRKLYVTSENSFPPFHFIYHPPFHPFLTTLCHNLYHRPSNPSSSSVYSKRVSPQGVDWVTRQPFFVKWFFVWSRKFSNPSTTSPLTLWRRRLLLWLPHCDDLIFSRLLYITSHSCDKTLGKL